MIKMAIKFNLQETAGMDRQRYGRIPVPVLIHLSNSLHVLVHSIKNTSVCWVTIQGLILTVVIDQADKRDLLSPK